MEEEKTKEEKPEILPAEVRAVMLSSEKSIFFNVALFEQAQRVAKLFSDSTMVPTQFRGNLGNCMIALNYAARIQADPFMVFQSLYEVKGRPGIEGKLVEAIINSSNKYSEPLQYEWMDPKDNIVERHIVLNHKDFEEFGCQAHTIDAKSGKRVDGPKITWKLVAAEGWNKDAKIHKTGEVIKSKWNTMPEMMFYYRAASWFGNKNCPELKLGMHTVEELEDIVELTPGRNGAYAIKDAAAALNDKLKADKDKPKTDIYETKEPEKEEKEEEKEEGEDQIRKLYINLRKPGFKEFVASHKEAIPNMEEKYQAEIRSKWQGFYPEEPYPLDAPKEEIPDKEPHTPPDETETENETIVRLVEGARLTESGMAVPCPNTNQGISVLRDKCDGIGMDVCKSRVKCPTWSEYDKASA